MIILDTSLFQAHLKSIFDNIQSVKFHDQDYNKILAIQSSEREEVPLDRPVIERLVSNFQSNNPGAGRGQRGDLDQQLASLRQGGRALYHQVQVQDLSACFTSLS